MGLGIRRMGRLSLFRLGRMTVVRMIAGCMAAGGMARRVTGARVTATAGMPAPRMSTSPSDQARVICREAGKRERGGRDRDGHQFSWHFKTPFNWRVNRLFRVV